MTEQRVFRRSVITAAAAVAALAAFGSGIASADNFGVGAAPGQTGRERACQVHADNYGQSRAAGQNCAHVVEPSLTVTMEQGPQDTLCHVSVVGTGLAPGTLLTLTTGDSRTVDSAGNARVDADTAVPEGSVLTASGTTASGDPITREFVVAC